MRLFEKLLGKKQAAPPAPQASKPSSAPPPGQAPSPPRPGAATREISPAIKDWNDYGPVVKVPSVERQKVPPESFKKSWNAPDGLAELVATCLRNSFVAECLDGARQLQRIDPRPRRGASLLGATLLYVNCYEEAQTVLEEAIERHGENTELLINLAKAFVGQGDQTRVESTLSRALEIDPNLDYAVPTFAGIHRERGGAQAEIEALRRVAERPGSWRPQLWLARRALEAKDLPAALALYQEALPRLKPVTTDALVQISGDLGQNGALKELAEICTPLFDVKQHGLQVGNNLLKAYVGLRDGPNARGLLGQLSAQERPDWREPLLFWEREIEKFDRSGGLLGELEKTETQFLVLEGPIWARADTPFPEMLPAKPGDAVKVAFICGSGEVPAASEGEKVSGPLVDALGSFTRGLPLFLAERIHIKTAANAMTLVPWTKSGGFALAGAPWTPKALAAVEQKPDFAVFLHVIAREESWQAKFKLVRVSDQKTVAEWAQTADPKNTTAAIHTIAKRTLVEILTGARVARQPAADALFPPTVSMLPRYISGLEQALAVLCAALTPETHPFLLAKRNPLDRLLDLCLRETDNVTMRMLLLSTVEREVRAHPAVAKEYRERLERLQREHPLRQAPRGLTDAALARIYAE